MRVKIRELRKLGYLYEGEDKGIKELRYLYEGEDKRIKEVGISL